MSRPDHRPTPQHPPHGQVGYLELPAVDVTRSAAFYERVFGWSVDARHGSFETPGMSGRWTTQRAPATAGGPVVWICSENLWPTLERVQTSGGRVHGRPRLDNGERWLAEINDPAGNQLGVVAPVRSAQPQPLIAVRDVEAASRWYQHLLGLRSDHGGPDYERLLADRVLVLQLHQREVPHHHGAIGDLSGDVGNGPLLWFGEVADFDDVVTRAGELNATVVRPPHRNPLQGQGNGPSHREIWLRDLDGYLVVVASPDGEDYEPSE